MKQIKNVFSVFDGMSCLQQALNRSGIKFERYYSSEIDKHAIKVTQANYPETIQLGSIIDINPEDFDQIDLFAGGSPCQSFSFAGKRKGMSTKDEIEIITLEQYLQLKSEGFEFEGQSYLFWEYMRLLTAFRKKNPNIKFLLENVMMGEKWEKILTKAIGVNPIEINSALVSAQNRRRLYWTNIGMIPGGLFGDPVSIIEQPKDNGVLLRDILENDVPDKYFLSKKMLQYFSKRSENFNQGKVNVRGEEGKGSGLTSSTGYDISSNFIAVNCNGKEHSDKSGSVLSRYAKGATNFGSDTFIKVDTNLKKSANQDKANCFTAGVNSGGLHSQMDLIKCVRMTGRNPENPKSRKSGLHTEQMIEERLDNKTGTLTTVQKDNLVMQVNPSKESGGQQPYQQNRVYDSNGISPDLCANKSDLLITNFDLLNERQLANHKKEDEKANTFLSTSFKGSQANGMTLVGNSKIRRLTPIECERLQTVPDNYTNHVSDTQRYRMLGNGWTVEVIVHILSYL